MSNTATEAAVSASSIALSPSSLEAAEHASNTEFSRTSNTVNNSRSCSRCGSISSNKSAIIASSNTDNLNDSSSYDLLLNNIINNNDNDQLPIIVKSPCCGSDNLIVDSMELSDERHNLQHQHYLSSGTMSRKSSITHLPNEQISSYGSYTSLSYRSSTPAHSEQGYGYYQQHHPRHHHHHHHHQQRHSQNKHHHQQYYHQYQYQPHYSSCKRAVAMSQPSSSSSVAHNPCNGRYTRRKSSSSTTLGDSFRKNRRRMNAMECSSVRGSETSIYEPLHIDVNSPCANTVVLTPSKITIEHNNHGKDISTHCQDDEESGLVLDNDRYATSSSGDFNELMYSSSPTPVKWNLAAHRDRHGKIGSDKSADFIEIISEPAHSELIENNDNSNILSNLNDNSNNFEIASKSTDKEYQQRDIKSISSTWRSTTMATTTTTTAATLSAIENTEEQTNTIIFHHECEMVENCCDNYYFQCNTSESDYSINNNNGHNNTECCDNNNPKNECTKSTHQGIIADDESSCSSKSANFNSKFCCKLSMKNHMQSTLNNSTSNATGSKTSQSSNKTNSSTAPLINFQKNNISSIRERQLDLSPDIKRYSKISNLEQQNAVNLTPNYFQAPPNPRSSSNLLPVSDYRGQQINQNLESNYFTDNKFNTTSRTETSTTATTSTSTSTSTSLSPFLLNSNQMTQTSSQSENPVVSLNSVATTSTAPISNFELFNLSTTTVYEKPFGGINLTTQNEFEPYSNRFQPYHENEVFQLNIIESDSSTTNVDNTGATNRRQQNSGVNTVNTTNNFSMDDCSYDTATHDFMIYSDDEDNDDDDNCDNNRNENNQNVSESRSRHNNTNDSIEMRDTTSVNRGFRWRIIERKRKRKKTRKRKKRENARYENRRVTNVVGNRQQHVNGINALFNTIRKRARKYANFLSEK